MKAETMAALKALSDRQRLSITRGLVVQSENGPVKTMLGITGLSDETEQNIPLIQPFGMSARPKGGDVILLQIGGTRSNLAAICADDSALRIPDLQPGEFGFRDYNGQQVVFRQDHLEVTTPLKLVANVTGDLDATVDGNATFNVTGNVNINATGNAYIDGAEVILAGGGKKVVLDGDLVVDGAVVSSATKSFAA